MPTTVANTLTTTDMGTAISTPNILIAGLGNELLMDDGVGVHAVRSLEERLGKPFCVAEVGTAVLHSLRLIEWADRIIAIDAVRCGKQPGEIVAFDSQGALKPEIQGSMHELSLVGALRFLTDNKPRSVVVVGVEPAEIAYGMELSPLVAISLPSLVETVAAIAERWIRVPLDHRTAGHDERPVWMPDTMFQVNAT